MIKEEETVREWTGGGGVCGRAWREERKGENIVIIF